MKPYIIVTRRKTTINHAFAAAVAPSDVYDEKRVQDAIRLLGQDPDADLVCAYCSAPAQTWDHIFATVKDAVFSGHGHRVGNLLPCCKSCNSSKGNKDWRRFLSEKIPRPHPDKAARIEAFLQIFGCADPLPQESEAYHRLLQIKAQVIELLAQADQLAKQVREVASQEHLRTESPSIERSSHS
ncbi:HNH endonuclease [Hydrogenophaga sp.]|uniref:HNH endonuclease signature motif containing protein n=1 Tax=Hydrogenophaga sp. TaxID=1904254 RepID=UPI0027436432|nr:HNH endonuclease [Hydrogenophaga sp.]MDP2418990.1 HNH endonuclease [Hydrogenophaga sp.]